MKKVVLVITVLAFCSSSFAGILKAAKINVQQQAAAETAQKGAALSVLHSALATSTCSFNFTSGVNNTFLKYCVTVNGNITQLQTPAGIEHIQWGGYGEGYGVCDTTTSVGYDDYADFGDSGNWGAPVTTHTATSVKVVRNTSDGIWTLTQTITQVPGNSSIKVVMALKNNTAVGRLAYLMRYADVDADGVFTNNLDGTTDSAFGWNSIAAGSAYGLSMQNTGNPAGLGWVGYAQNVASGPNPCTPFTAYVGGPLAATDGSIVMFYSGTVPAKGTRTATLTYKGM